MNTHRLRPFLLAALLLSCGLWTSITPASADPPHCAISGPSRVEPGRSFTLCGPDADAYEWSGNGLKGDSRCADISGLSAGTYTYTLKTWGGGPGNGNGHGKGKGKKGNPKTCSFTVRVGSGGSGSGEGCITGPTSVDVGESFTLCGPSGEKGDHDGDDDDDGEKGDDDDDDDDDVALKYDWDGVGTSGIDDNARCITIHDLAAGTYTYTLHLSGDRTRTCTWTVTVGKKGDGCITGPSSVDVGDAFTLCGPSEAGLSYDWDGTGTTTVDDNSRCLTIDDLPAGTYTYTLYLSGNGSSRTCTWRVTVGKDGEEDEVSCITGATEVFVDDDFTLCGPEGADAYLWTLGPDASGATSRCVTIDDHVAPGFYTYRLSVTDNGSTHTCSYRVHVFAADDACIIGAGHVDAGAGFTLCGPPIAGYTYRWRGTGIQSDSTNRCVNVSGRGTGLYTYTLFIGGVAPLDTCRFIVRVGDLDEDTCPLTATHWRNACDAGGAAWQDTLAMIADCVDAHSEYFDWVTPRTSVCDLWHGTDTGSRAVLSRNFAALLADLCARDLAIAGHDGDQIGLDWDDDVDCNIDGVGNVAELVAYTDILLSNAGETSELQTRRMHAAECIGNLLLGRESACGSPNANEPLNGKWINTTETSASGSTTQSLDQATARDLDTPFPNPFSGTTRMRFAVMGSGERVSLGVYDISGRLVQKLADGVMDPGVHEVQWSGSGDGGERVRPGVYFLRGQVGDRSLSSRIMLVD